MDWDRRKINTILGLEKKTTPVLILHFLMEMDNRHPIITIKDSLVDVTTRQILPANLGRAILLCTYTEVAWYKPQLNEAKSHGSGGT